MLTEKKQHFIQIGTNANNVNLPKLHKS